jgi:hypothetical protein
MFVLWMSAATTVVAQSSEPVDPTTMIDRNGMSADGIPSREDDETQALYTDFDVGPKIKLGKIPLFPPSFVRSGRKESALIRYTVSAEGKPETVEVLETTDQKFSGHIAAVMRRSSFRPATKNGVAVRGTVLLRISLE